VRGPVSIRSRSAAAAAVAAVAPALLALVWSVPCSAGYKIPVWAGTSGGGSGSASDYQLTYTIGQSSPGGISAGAATELKSGLVPMLSDLVPPAIVHLPIQQVPARTSVEILAAISDRRSGIDTVKLFFREGGFYAFREKPMLNTDENLYLATLPPSSVTERGLVYYIEAADTRGNVSHYPAGAPDSLLNLPVAFTDLASPVLPAGQYRMVSLPGTPTDGSPDTVVVDDLGFYGRKAWRLGRWNPEGCAEERCYDEYPSIEDFAPGRAFWLISSEARSFDFSGVSADITRSFRITLDRGWNQIAAPFGFATDWLSAGLSYAGKSYSIGDLYVAGPDTLLVEDNLIAYDGSYQGFQSDLAPWQGYWVYNASNVSDVDLLLSPLVAASANLAAASQGSRGRPALPDRLDFALGLRVSSPERGQHLSIAGASAAAGDAWDALDLHQPPAIGEFTRGVFLRKDWGSRSGRYLADVKRTNPDGISWEFLVESSSADHPSLALESSGILPSGWKVVLYDLEAGLGIDAESLPYSFSLDGGRRFLLVAGTPGFVEAQEASGGLALKPGIVAAEPNPFGASVKIVFYLPDPGPASLRVYSVDGRLVRTLEERALGRGIHSVTWDSRSSSGAQAAPGLYFVRLEAQGASQVRKVMRISR